MFVSIADLESRLSAKNRDEEGGVADLSAESDVSTANQPVNQQVQEQVQTQQDQAQQSQEQTYTPNYKWKFGDKEIEADEPFRAVVKDKQTEDLLRNLYQKAHEYDPIKAERDQYNAHYQQVAATLKNLQDWRQNDPIRFFQATGWTDKELVTLAQQIISFHQLPAEQKTAYIQQSQQQSEMAQLQNQAQYWQQASEQTQQEMLKLQTQQVLGQPDVSQAAAAYDSTVGRPGAFEKIFIMHGSFLSNQAGRNVAPRDVLDSLRQAYPNLFQAPSQIQQPITQNRPGAQVANQSPAQQAKPKTIPSFGTAASPAPVSKRRFNSIKDLEAYVQQRRDAEDQ
jgi:hypothetical protein